MQDILAIAFHKKGFHLPAPLQDWELIEKANSYSMAWISNHVHRKVWDESTFPSANFNGGTVEDCEMDK